MNIPVLVSQIVRQTMVLILAKLTGMSTDQCQALLTRLLQAGRVEARAGKYSARSFAVPLGAQVGFEAAVFDHFQALVKTVCCRLQNEPSPLPLEDPAPTTAARASNASVASARRTATQAMRVATWMRASSHSASTASVH